MTSNRIDDYLRRLRDDLRMRGLSDADTLAEIESHLFEAVEQGQQRGLGPAEAERQALERFGSAGTVASAFQKERKTRMQKILLILAVLAGLLVAYVDSRPTWDDTGISAGTMFLTSGLLVLLGHRQPWLIALAVGLWTPLYELSVSRNSSLQAMLLFPGLILAICLSGAYAGWAVQQGIRKVWRPA